VVFVELQELLDIVKKTIRRWFKIAGTHSKKVPTYFLRNNNLKRLEVDKIWSYVEFKGIIRV
jgi:hypothetical protein